MLESIVHGAWKEYENNSESFLLAKETDVQVRIIRPHLYVLLYLRFHIAIYIYIYIYICNI